MAYPITYGPYGPVIDTYDQWARLARDRAKQSAGSVPRATTRRTTTAEPAAPAPPAFDPYASANQGVEAMISAMLAQVDREQQAAYARAQQEAALEAAKGQALAEGLKALGIQGNVESAFRNAANAQAGLAQGFSGAIRDQAAEQAAVQQRALAGTGQEGAVRNQGENMGNVQYGIGGYMPSTALNTMAAAFGADAALQPGFALQFGAVNQANRLADYANNELPGFLNQRLDVIGQRPALTNDLLNNAFDRENTLYNRRITERDYAAKQKAAAAEAKQSQMDRRVEAIALKMSYGIPLTKKERALLNNYGLSSGTAQTLIRGKQQAADDQRAAKLQAAKDRATAARQAEADARKAYIEAQKAAARSRLESDKAKARRALEEYKAAQRRKLQAQRDAAAMARQKAKPKRKKKSGAASSPDSRGGTGYFGG